MAKKVTNSEPDIEPDFDEPNQAKLFEPQVFGPPAAAEAAAMADEPPPSDPPPPPYDPPEGPIPNVPLSDEVLMSYNLSEATWLGANNPEAFARWMELMSAPSVPVGQQAPRPLPKAEDGM